MKKIILVLAAAALLCGCGNTQKQYTGQSFAMDTVFTQLVYADTVLVTASNDNIVSEIENLMSKTIPTSDIYRINRSMGHNTDVNAETAKIVRACLEAAEHTGGAFNPALGDIIQLWGFGTEAAHVPPRARINTVLGMSDYNKVEVKGENAVNAGGVMLDLGGAVKGYTLDVLRENLDLLRAGPALLDMGGSVYARGLKPDGAPWIIGIRDPFGSATDYMGTLKLTDGCVSTSGSYERGFTEGGRFYHHIIDPKTGYPAQNGLVSVSVMDADGLRTDIYSTALFVMGPEEGVIFAEENGISALFITEDRKIHKTGGFSDAFNLTDSGYEEF